MGLREQEMEVNYSAWLATFVDVQLFPETIELLKKPMLRDIAGEKTQNSIWENVK